jgi:hypothetical protein
MQNSLTTTAVEENIRMVRENLKRYMGGIAEQDVTV